MQTRERSAVCFWRTVPGSSRRSYHRFVVATVSSFKKGTPRVSGWKDIFSRHIFLFVQGAGHQPPNNIGSFYAFPYKEAGCRSSLRALSFFPRYVTFVAYTLKLSLREILANDFNTLLIIRNNLVRVIDDIDTRLSAVIKSFNSIKSTLTFRNIIIHLYF